MKTKYLLLMLMCFSVTVINGQSVEKHFVFTNVGFSFGEFYGGGIAMNYIRHEKVNYQVGVSVHYKRSEDIPSDYYGGLFQKNLPWDEIILGELLVGHVIGIGRVGAFRLNLKAGLGLGVYKEIYDWKPAPPRGWYNLVDRNYTFGTKSKTVGFIVFKPELEFMFLKFIGYSITPFVKINSDLVFYGCQVNMQIGKVRGGLKKLN